MTLQCQMEGGKAGGGKPQPGGVSNCAACRWPREIIAVTAAQAGAMFHLDYGESCYCMATCIVAFPGPCNLGPGVDRLN
ncbi:hypothetical protein JZ751_011889 [Albula glossodonta]|uniref:Uncharacterized protein n=1 Tax=Albula glossodonta TaxID=121402 RepID=A0A8T2PR02_9TELE|nr:hypothetical protein JZ751_011889 [Albula glossodonta]